MHRGRFHCRRIRLGLGEKGGRDLKKPVPGRLSHHQRRHRGLLCKGTKAACRRESFQHVSRRKKIGGSASARFLITGRKQAKNSARFFFFFLSNFFSLLFPSETRPLRSKVCGFWRTKSALPFLALGGGEGFPGGEHEADGGWGVGDRCQVVLF